MEETTLTVRLRDGSENVFKESSNANDLLSLIDSVRTIQRQSNDRLSELVEEERRSQADSGPPTSADRNADDDSISGSDEDGGN